MVGQGEGEGGAWLGVRWRRWAALVLCELWLPALSGDEDSYGGLQIAQGAGVSALQLPRPMGQH